MYHLQNPAFAASSTARPSCPPGYTVTAVKKSGAHVYSFECASTSAMPPAFSCPPGFTAQKVGFGRYRCTRISGQVRAHNPAMPQRCPPGMTWTQDLGCVAIPKGIKNKHKCGPGLTWTEDLGCTYIPPRKSRCAPGLTWTEDLGCVAIPKGIKNKHKCGPGLTWTEDLGCVAIPSRRHKRNNPGGVMARPASKQCPPCGEHRACNTTTGKCEPRDIKLPPPGGDPLPNRAGGRRQSYNPKGGSQKNLLAMCCAKQDEYGKCIKWVSCGPQQSRADTIRRVRNRIRQTARRLANPGCGCGPRVSNPDGSTACCASCAAGGPCGG